MGQEKGPSMNKRRVHPLSPWLQPPALGVTSLVLLPGRTASIPFKFLMVALGMDSNTGCGSAEEHIFPAVRVCILIIALTSSL